MHAGECTRIIKMENAETEYFQRIGIGIDRKDVHIIRKNAGKTLKTSNNLK